MASEIIFNSAGNCVVNGELSVEGNNPDINDAVTCIAVDSQNTKTKVTITNSKPNEYGGTFSLNVDSDRVFTIRSDSDETDYVQVDEFGSLVINANAFYILRKANVNKILQSSTAATTITTAGTYYILANGNGINLSASNQFFDYDPTFTNRVIYRGLYAGDAKVTITIRSYIATRAGSGNVTKSFRLYKNGVPLSIIVKGVFNGIIDSTAADNVTINTIIDLAPNDYLDVYCTATGTGTTSATLVATDISTTVYLI